MLIIVPAVLLIVFFAWMLFKPTKGGHDSQYSHNHNWVDFDAGVDSDKIGDKEYPTAGVDAVMKHEFLDDLMKNDDK